MGRMPKIFQCLVLRIVVGFVRDQVEITLSPNETALIDPSPYFNNKFLDFNITQSDSPSAAVLPQLEVKEVSEAETQGTEWRFAASVVTNEFAFFTVLYAHKVEVWRVDGNSLSKEWETDANVVRVVGVSVEDVEGFVYWTHSSRQLHFIDLLRFPLSANEIKGVDLSSAVHLAVCSKRKLFTAAQRTSSGYIFTSYSINYEALLIEKIITETASASAEEVLDVLCIEKNYYLSTQTLYTEFNYMQIPKSFGTPISLAYIETNTIYARTAGGAVVIEHFLLHFPGVAKILSIGNITILVHKYESKWALAAEDWTQPMSVRRRVLLDMDSPDCVLWLESISGSRHLVAVKQGGRVKLVAIRIGTSLLRVAGHSSTYTLTLCGTKYLRRPTSDCVQLTINPLLESYSGILMCDGQRLYSPLDTSMSYSVALNKRSETYTLNFIARFSGPNIEVTGLYFPNLPAYMSYTPIFSGPVNTESTADTLATVDNSAEFLCASFHPSVSKIVLLYKAKIIESSTDEVRGIDIGDFTDIACAYADGILWVYRRDRSQYGQLLQTSASTFETIEVEAESNKFICMVASSSHVLLLFAGEALILSLDTGKFQRISAKTDYISTSINENFLVLQTSTTLEYYEKHFSRYENQCEFPIAENTVQFTILNNALMTLNSENSLHMYHISVDNQLTQRFVYKPLCRVLYLDTTEYNILYRCEEHVQLVAGNEHWNAHEWVRIATRFALIPVAHKAMTHYIKELYKIEGKWTILTTPVAVSPNLQSQFALEISSEYAPTGSIMIEGVLEVSNQHSSQVAIPLYLTLENHGAVITMTEEAGSIGSSGGSSVIEVPWDEELVIEPMEVFQGELMLFAAQSSDPRVHVTVQNPIEVDFTFQGLNSALDVQIALETKTLFYCFQGLLIARGFNCVDQSCAIVSEHSIPLSALNATNARHLDVLISVKTFSILRLLVVILTGDIYQIFSSIVSFSTKTLKFEVICSLALHSPDYKHYVVEGSSNNFHIFLYHHVLEHCIGAVETEVSLKCTEVNVPRLIQINSIGSKQTSDRCWEVYALTKTQELFTFQLCDVLTFLTATPLNEFIKTSMRAARIISNKLIAPENEMYGIYSLPDFRLLNQVPWTILKNVEFTRNYQWSDENILASSGPDSKTYYFFDIGLPKPSMRLAKLPLVKLQFTRPNQAAGFANGTLLFFHISHGKIVVEKDESQVDTVETEVEITARNELSEATMKLRIVRRAKTRQYWVVPTIVVGVCVYFLVTKYEGRRAREEIELQTLARNNSQI